MISTHSALSDVLVFGLLNLPGCLIQMQLVSNLMLFPAVVPQ